jgi:sialidase-1
MTNQLMGSIVLVIVLAVGSANAEQFFQETDVFFKTSGDPPNLQYRIPAIVVSNKGTLVAFCENRMRNNPVPHDIDIVVKRSFDNGVTWTKTQVAIGDDGEKVIVIGNPCPVVDRCTGTIWLPYNRHDAAHIRNPFITHSTDDGATWAEAVEITAIVKPAEWTKWYAFGPGVGIQLEKGPHVGRLVIPSNHERPAGKEIPHIVYSDDHGKTWVLGGSTPDTGANETQAVELVNGDILMIGRPTGNIGCQLVTTSSDSGKTWTQMKAHKDLVAPTCQSSVCRFTTADKHGKNRILFSNPSSTSDRVDMVIRLSYDEGKTWPVSRLLHKGSAAYSCLVVFPDRTIGCLYESGGYKKIVLARFNLDWLTACEERG